MSAVSNAFAQRHARLLGSRRGLEQVHAHRGCKLSRVGLALRAALAGLEATEPEPADTGAADEAARAHAEWIVELERQHVELERAHAELVAELERQHIADLDSQRLLMQRAQVQLTTELELQCVELERLAADAAKRAADEVFIAIPEPEKRADDLFAAVCTAGDGCFGIVTDILLWKKRDLRLYTVTYSQAGKYELLTADQVRKCRVRSRTAVAPT